MRDPLEERYELARRLAVDAGRLTLQYYRSTFEVETKPDGSPVTVADRSAEELIRQAVQSKFPSDGILGEEYGAEAGSSGYRWIVDPIDGTKSFVSGVPLYGTMVAVEFAGTCQCGAVYFPPLDELIHARLGHGAWHGTPDQAARPARASDRQRLADGLFVTSDVRNFHQRGAARVFNELERTAALTRTWGDCYGYYLVATGRALVMVDPILSTWDAAAIQPIVIESGGRFTDWQGRGLITSGDAVGCAPGVQEEVLAVTRSV